MKSIRLSTVLVGAILCLNIGTLTLNAQNIKSVTVIKNTTETKSLQTKKEAMKSNSNKSDDARIDVNTNINTDWRRKNHNHEYQRGKIRTH